MTEPRINPAQSGRSEKVERLFRLAVRRDELLSIKLLLISASVLQGAFSSSPRDAGVGRGPRRGAAPHKVPPLPDPLLHPMEEREFPWLRLYPAESICGFSPRAFNGNY